MSKNDSAIAMLLAPKKKGSPMGDEPDDDEGDGEDEAGDKAVEALFDAIDSRDVKAFREAFSTLKDLL